MLKANELVHVPTIGQFVANPNHMSILEIAPSAGMMQSFLTAMCGDSAVRMNFVLGVSGLEGIRQNGLEGTRDVGIPYHPWAPLPEKTHGGVDVEKERLLLF